MARAVTLAPSRARSALPLALLGIYALTWAQFAFVESANFQGFDEWLTLWLTSRGIVAVPHTPAA